MPRKFKHGASYYEKLAASSPEVSAQMEANRRAKMSAGIKKTRAIQRIINAILKPFAPWGAGGLGALALAGGCLKTQGGGAGWRMRWRLQGWRRGLTASFGAGGAQAQDVQGNFFFGRAARRPLVGIVSKRAVAPNFPAKLVFVKDICKGL